MAHGTIVHLLVSNTGLKQYSGQLDFLTGLENIIMINQTYKYNLLFGLNA